MFRTLAFLLLILFLAACSTGPRVTTLVGEPLTPETTHLVGVEQFVYVGDAMTSSTPLVVIERVTLDYPLSATTSHRGKPMAMTADPGIYVLVRQNAKGKFYEATGDLLQLNDRVLPGGLFLANEGGVSALYRSGAWSRDVHANHRLGMYLAELEESPEVAMSYTRRPVDTRQGFVATLSYMGMAGGQIKFVYREYIDGLARAAFTQEVSLDYKPEETYAFKSARFIVHEANTSDLTFTLLQSL